MNAQFLTIAGVALLVLIVARASRADPTSAEYANDPNNWNYIRGYAPGTGYYT